jgi:hypothetical protein
MNLPIVLLAGEAGAGKDHAATTIVREFSHLNPVAMGQADEIKRFAGRLFDFSPLQLWGPSEHRNAVDERVYRGIDGFWKEVDDRTSADWVKNWVARVGKDAQSNPVIVFRNWYTTLATTYRYKLSPRIVLQTLGTEFGRNLNSNVWSNLTLDAAQKVLNGGYGYTRENGVDVFEGAKDHSLVVVTDGRFRNEVLNAKRLGAVALKIVRWPPKESVGIKGHASEASLAGIPDEWFDAVIQNDFSSPIKEFENKVSSILAEQFRVKRY